MKAALAIVLVSLATTASAREPLVRVPFVGCPADGQAGPIPAPKAGRTIAIPRGSAARLAYYADKDFGVLAPRGWHCFALYGSNGSTIIVTPEKHVSDDFFGAKSVSIRGPAVQVSYSVGGTSGRLSVMPAIARYFPRYRPFIIEMKKLELDFGALRARPYNTDVIRARTSNYLRFTTPAGKKGEGTNSRLDPSNLPIEGIRRILGTPKEPDLLSVNVRLPPRLAGLTETILANAK